MPRCSVVLLVLGSLACLPGMGQSVISAHAGVVNFSEGDVFIDGQPVAQKLGKFSNVQEGSTLSTKRGRAEVLLTPGVFLRMGDNSSVRMLSTSLANARVEFVEGSAIVESADAPAETALTLVYKDYQVNLPKESMFRFDSVPARFRVMKGDAQVSLHGESLTLREDQALTLDGFLVAGRSETASPDALDQWAQKRNDTIVADNESASKTTDDLDQADGWQNGSDLGLGPSVGAPDPGAGPYSGPAPSVPSVTGPSIGSGSYDPLSLNPVSPFSLYSSGVYPYAPGLFYYGYVPVLIGRPHVANSRAPVTVSSSPTYSVWGSRYRLPAGYSGYRSPAGVYTYRSPVVTVPTYRSPLITTRPLGSAISRPTPPVISHPVTASPRPMVVSRPAAAGRAR